MAGNKSLKAAVRANGENSLSLRLESELSDLRLRMRTYSR